MQEESENDDSDIELGQLEWSFDMWKTEYSQQGKFLKHINPPSVQHSNFHPLEKDPAADDSFLPQQFNRKARRKLQNKINARKSRDRKKQQIEFLKNRQRQLEYQNQLLRREKTCKWCSRSNKTLKCPRIHYTYKQYPEEVTEKKPNNQYTFEKFEPAGEKRRGKIWIALGLVMLVVGIQINGFTGNSEKCFSIPKYDLEEWREELSSNSEAKHLNMRIKQKSKSEIKKQGSILEKVSGFLDRVFFEGKESYNIKWGSEEEEKFTLNTDLLYAINAEIDANGLYI